MRSLLTSSAQWMRAFVRAGLCFLTLAQFAEAKVYLVAEDSSEATTTSAALDTSGGTISVKLCGGSGAGAFSGSFVVKQGMAPGNDLVQTYSSGAISSLDGCSVVWYLHEFADSPFTQVIITRSAGTYTMRVRSK